MASTGSPISALADFITTTGQAILSPRDHITNAARRQTHILKHFMPGLKLDGGSKIADVIYLEVDSSAQHVGINPELDYRIRDVLSDWEVPWRFTVDHYTIPEQAVELNTSGLGAAARFQQFKKYRDGAEINLTTSQVNLLDGDFFAQPNFSTMESAGGFDPYSLAVFFNEEIVRTVSGVAGTAGSVNYTGVPSADVDVNGDTWTGIQGLDPAVLPGWQAPYVQYDTFGDVRQGANLIDAFQLMSDILNFEAMPWRPEYGQKTMLEYGYGLYACSLEGKKNYVNTLMSSGDALADISDPHITGPGFYGTPLQYIKILDSAPLYPDTGVGAVTESDTTADNQGPRYYALKINDPMHGVSKVCHPNHVFRMKDPFFPSHQPYNLVVVSDTYHNNPCSSRIQGGGVIGPITLATRLPV